MVEDSEGWALKEGYFGGINFVDAGVVFFQVVTRDFREVLYDEFSSLDDGEYHEKNYLGEDGHGEGDDLLEILDTHPSLSSTILYYTSISVRQVFFTFYHSYCYFL